MKRMAATAIACIGVACVVGCSSENGADTGDSVETQSPSTHESAAISPSPAKGNSQLRVRFQAGQSMSPADYSFVWQRNGEEIMGPEGPTLEPSYFQKGDLISVEVIPHELSAATNKRQETSVEILNTPPTIVSAATFLGTRSAREIYLSIECRDADGDRTSFSYKWYVDGQLLPGQTGPTLEPALAGRGDQVYAEVVANDGEASSAPLNSVPVTLDNHGPRIVSEPPSPARTDDIFVYAVMAEDADSDPLSFELVSGPPGMTVDSEGTVEWVMPPAGSRSGDHLIKIKASDPHGGSAVQEFRISFVASPR